MTVANMRIREIRTTDVDQILSAPWDVTRHEYKEFGFDLHEASHCAYLQETIASILKVGCGFAIEDDDGIVACPMMFHIDGTHKDGDWSMWFIGGERLPTVALPLIRRMKKWLSSTAIQLGVNRFVCETKEVDSGKWFQVLGFEFIGRGYDNTWRYVWTRRH